MRVLIDTNVLLRSAEPEHVHFQPSVDAIDLLRQQGHELTIVPQVPYEFWSVAIVQWPSEPNRLPCIEDIANDNNPVPLHRASVRIMIEIPMCALMACRPDPKEK